MILYARVLAMQRGRVKVTVRVRRDGEKNVTGFAKLDLTAALWQEWRRMIEQSHTLILDERSGTAAGAVGT